MTDRLRSLDVFRGATVALMILVNNPGSWGHLYSPLAHAAWHGMTPTDLVFPWFLFAVGNALALVMVRDEQRAGAAGAAGGAGVAPASAWLRIARRTALIFAIGLFLNASPFVRWDAQGDLVWRAWENLRFMGVLQRIALAYGAAACIVMVLSATLARRASASASASAGTGTGTGTGTGATATATAAAARRRAVLWISALLLLGYWAACLLWGTAGDPYSLQGFFGTALDRSLLGVSHLYKGEGVPFDPEGLASTVPAVAQVLLGWWVGDGLARARARAGAGASAGAGVIASAQLPHVVASTPLAVRAANQVVSPGLNWEKVSRLFLAACALLVLAYLWQLVMPLNKKIWTSSYVLATTGLAMAALAVLLVRIDLAVRPAPGSSREARGARDGFRVGGGALGAGCVRLLEAFGQNALFVFVLSGFLPRVLALLRWPSGTKTDGSVAFTSPLPWWHEQVIAPVAGVLSADPRWASLLFALVNLAAYGALAGWLARRHIFIRV
jgi:predicted acyltransferase